MAISAFHQPFVHLVVERLAESRLHIAVAAKAELRLGSLEQVRVLPRCRHRSRGPLQRIAYARVWFHRTEKARQRFRLLRGACGWRCGTGGNRYGGETMDAVATRATHAGLAVIGAQKIGMSTRMTAKAGRIDLRRGHLAQLQNLSRVSSGSDVRSPGSMAALTGDTFAAMHERQFGVRVRGELCRNIRVTQSTGLRAGKL